VRWVVATRRPCSPPGSPPPPPRRITLIVLTGRIGAGSGEAQDVEVAPLNAAPLLLVGRAVTEEGERRRAGVRWSGHARLWRRRGNVHSPHAAHRPGFPAEGAYPETYGTGGESRSGMQGRWVWWCLRIVGGGIDRLSSFLVASGWKLGRGGSYGCTADPPCPRFACESLSSSSLAARRPPHQIRIWRGAAPGSSDSRTIPLAWGA
jgi:hypothetical protein